MPKAQTKKKRFTHTGTDCSHRTRGMCDRCKEPMKVRYISRPSEAKRRSDENGTS